MEELTAVVSIVKGNCMISAVHVGGIEAAKPLTLPKIPWMKLGACRGTKDPDKFFRERADRSGVKNDIEGNTKDAKKMCRGCPVATECLLWALEHDEEYGIWGGSTPDERHKMKRYM